MVLPDHYKTLNCDPSASQAQIRDAYKRAALATHPDRFPPSSAEAAAATKNFQRVSDAYFVLGDPDRRSDYDRHRAAQEPTGTDYFATDADRQHAYENEFKAAFEEMFRESETSFGHNDEAAAEPDEQHSTSKFYTILTGLAGGVIGFTIANVPGALAGLAIGAKLGSIRDSRGKSVYEVFQELPREDRARVLAELAQKVFTSVPLS
ncbi:DnaJ domain-containing protein [Lipomyces orientalis]|uniref:DnaJ domain-containing protein n=1 Tax=Lipomyces orientalis TaxID=1233043 RepID=A0ACC3TET7_9ASCO